MGMTYKTKVAAFRVRVSTRWLSYHIEAGHIPEPDKRGGHWRWTAQNIADAKAYKARSGKYQNPLSKSSRYCSLEYSTRYGRPWYWNDLSMEDFESALDKAIERVGQRLIKQGLVPA